LLKMSRNIDCANIIDRARVVTADSELEGGISNLGVDNNSFSDYIDDQDFSGSLTNTEGDRPSKCTISITDSRSLSWSINRKLPRRRRTAAASATISEKFQSVIHNAIQHGRIRDAIQGQSNSSSSSSATAANTNILSSTRPSTEPTAQHNNPRYIPFLYPYIKIPYLLESLQNYSDNGNDYLKGFLRLLLSGSSTVSLELLSHFSVIPCGVKNSSPDVDAIRTGGCIDSVIYRFHCSNEYCFKRGNSYLLNKTSRRYDCAMFKYEDSNGEIIVQPARIFSILKLVDDSLLDLPDTHGTSRKRSHSAPSSYSMKARSTRTMLEKVRDGSKKYSSRVLESNDPIKSFTPTTLIHRREPKDSVSSLSSYKDEDDKILLLICWLVPASKGIQRNCFPYPLYKYDTFLHGSRRVLYTQIVHPSCLYLPLYTIHDVNTRPSYETEGSSLECIEKDRFWSFPFEIFRKMRRQYFGCFPNQFLFTDNDVANYPDPPVNEREVVESIKVVKVVSKQGNVTNPLEDNCSDSGDDEEDDSGCDN
jgi:hypothetical protein